MKSKFNNETVCVHAGVRPEPTAGAVMTPIFLTSTYAQEEPGKPKAWDYARAGNPTRAALEESLAAIEGAKYGFTWASGLAATQAVIQLLEPGSHVLVSEDGYGGSGRLFRSFYEKYGIAFEFADFRKPSEVIARFTNKTKLVWLESPTNPLLRLADISAISAAARKNGAITVVDNTFATPIFQRPLDLGADIVMHSTTKYIGGHSDLIGGALMTSSSDIAERLKFIQFAGGSINSPFDSFLILRSIKTLAIRMKKHNENAMVIAHALQKIPDFSEVIYPGLESHPQYHLAKTQMSGTSGVISIRLKGDHERHLRFFKGLKVFTLAESLGGVESLVNHPLTMTHASVPENLREKLGITADLIRLSVGIEDSADLIEDIKQALTQK